MNENVLPTPPAGWINPYPLVGLNHLHRRVAAIVTPAATPAALAAKSATTTIPVVFSTGADPIQIGLVGSLHRPGCNVTGVGGMIAEVGAKRLGLLQELVPRAERFATLFNLTNPLSIALTRETQSVAATMGRQIELFSASTNSDIDMVFASLAQKRIDALSVAPDTLFINRRVQLATLAVRYAIPAIYPFHEDAEAATRPLCQAIVTAPQLISVILPPSAASPRQ